MADKSNELVIIGRAERADFIDLKIDKLPVKIDTGADASSIWAHAVEKKEDENLHVIFFGEESDFYTGVEHIFSPDEYVVTRVANSFGHREIRYKVKLRIRIKGRLINGSFSLSDRSKKLYPVLIGRSLLAHKFLVDVSKGSPLRAEEKKRKERMQEELETIKGKAL